MNIATIDFVIIIGLLIGVILIGVYQVTKKRETSDGFFLAGRDLKWPFIGLSLFAANISTIHLVGLAASGFNEGLVWGAFEWLAGVTLIMLALIFAPYYFKSRIQTLPEFLERRYDPRSRTVFAFIAIQYNFIYFAYINHYTTILYSRRAQGCCVDTSLTNWHLDFWFDSIDRFRNTESW